MLSVTRVVYCIKLLRKLYEEAADIYNLVKIVHKLKKMEKTLKNETT